MKTVEVCRKHWISPNTFYRWKAKLAGLNVSNVRKLRVFTAGSRDERMAVCRRRLLRSAIQAPRRRSMAAAAGGHRATVGLRQDAVDGSIAPGILRSATSRAAGRDGCRPLPSLHRFGIDAHRTPLDLDCPGRLKIVIIRSRLYDTEPRCAEHQWQTA